MSTCNSIRNCTRLRLGYFRQHAVSVRAPQARGLATSHVSLSSRIPDHSALFRFSGCNATRSYWWFSRTTKPESSPPNEVPQSDNINTPPNSPSGVTLSDAASDSVTSEQTIASSESVAPMPDFPADLIPPLPLQLGDLKELGFCNFTPVGAVQAGLEFVQVTTGLPWWATIVLSTLIARLAIVHFTITSARASAKMAPHRPQMEALMKEANEAKMAQDQLRLQVAALKLTKLRKDNGFGFASSLVGPLSQGLVSISMFMGIKKLCDFPLPQLKFESAGWLTSLSAPDPFYILPALSLVLMNLQIHLSKPDMAAGGERALHVANAFRVLGVVFLPVVAHLPAALVVYLVSNIGLLALQNKVLHIPAVRRSLDIPVIPRPSHVHSPSLRDSWDALRQWLRNKDAEARQNARERANVPTFPPNSRNSAPMQRSSRQVSKGRKV